MIFPGCQKEVTADRRFCTWCEGYIPDPAVGTKAGFGRRFGATILDVVLFWVLFFLIASLLAGGFGAAGGRETNVGGLFSGLFLAWLAYTVFLLWFLSKGLTPGKLLTNEQVVEHLKGGHAGLGKMLVREVFGKFVSGLFMGLGYFWAIWDKDSQAWHDKIAGTVVVRRPASLTVSPVTASPVAATRGGFCTACGARVAPDQRFCSSCGAALG